MRVLLLIVALSVCSYVWSDESSDHKATSYKAQKTEQQNPIPKNQSVSTDNKSEIVKDTTKQLNTNTNDKLNTDWQLVEYTRQLAFFTAFLAIFTAVLAVVAIWQGVQLKRSVDSSERIERPYIFLEKIDIERREPINVPNAWYISLKFKNVGRTPAIIKEYIAHIQNLAELPRIPVYEKLSQFEHVNTLSPQKGFWTGKFGPAIQITPEGHDIRYIVYGRLVYEDTQGGLHKTGFALEVGTHIPMAHQHNNWAYNYHT